MEEGVVMVGKDGSRLIMKGQSLWREALEAAGSTYAKATAEPRFSKPKERTIDLQDGGRVTMDRDGAMVHFDQTGKRIPMADGEVMIARDGSRILMANGTMWRPSKAPAARP
jgi:ferric-dicitrate binding protein FerR (iron transport regulator)